MQIKKKKNQNEVRVPTKNLNIFNIRMNFSIHLIIHQKLEK